MLLKTDKINYFQCLPMLFDLSILIRLLKAIHTQDMSYAELHSNVIRFATILMTEIIGSGEMVFNSEIFFQLRKCPFPTQWKK